MTLLVSRAFEFFFCGNFVLQQCKRLAEHLTSTTSRLKRFILAKVPDLTLVCVMVL